MLFRSLQGSFKMLIQPFNSKIYFFTICQFQISSGCGEFVAKSFVIFLNINYAICSICSKINMRQKKVNIKKVRWLMCYQIVH